MREMLKQGGNLFAQFEVAMFGVLFGDGEVREGGPELHTAGGADAGVVAVHHSATEVSFAPGLFRGCAKHDAGFQIAAFGNEPLAVRFQLQKGRRIRDCALC